MYVTAADSDTRAFFDRAWTPRVPLAAMGKTGPYKRTTRAKALRMPYVEANPTALCSLIVTDVDTSEVEELAFMSGLPDPSWTVRKHGPVGTGHIAYALAAPVCLTDAASRRPVNLLARIETGVRDVLGGDTSYTGRIMKNPCSIQENHDTLWGEELPTYGLHDLAKALEELGALPPWNDPRPRQNSGIGRNVDIFDRTRKWSYRAVKRYWVDGFTTWKEVVEAHAMMANFGLETEGRTPLPAQEVQQLSTSIAHWVWTRFTPQDFAAIQAARGRKSGQRRTAKAIVNGRTIADAVYEA